MRKDELLYLHQLLTVVRTECERRGDVSADAFGAYDELSVSPVAAYAQKNDHKQAVCLLASGLAESATGGGDVTARDHRQSASY